MHLIENHISSSYDFEKYINVTRLYGFGDMERRYGRIEGRIRRRDESLANVKLWFLNYFNLYNSDENDLLIT